MLAALFLTACGGAAGDQPTASDGDPLGSCGRLSTTIGDATWLDPVKEPTACTARPADRTVCLSGLTVLALDTFDEVGDGSARGNYYLEDTSEDPAPYSGVTIYRPSFSPPDLRLIQGDVVDFFGSLQEFIGPTSTSETGFNYCRTLPELGGALTLRFDSRDAVPPKVIPLDALKSYVTARPYVGMLVKVLNPQLGPEGAKTSNGRYSAAFDVGALPDVADLPYVTNELFDMAAEGPPMPGGTKFKSITGIVTYFYSFHIAPRSAADIEL
jgi:hypothetical protein